MAKTKKETSKARRGPAFDREHAGKPDKWPSQGKHSSGRMSDAELAKVRQRRRKTLAKKAEHRRSKSTNGEAVTEE